MSDYHTMRMNGLSPSGLPIPEPALTNDLCNEVRVLRDELDDNDRWMREVLTDFRIPFDDHKVGRRLAFTQWMCERQNAFDAHAAAMADLGRVVPLLTAVLDAGRPHSHLCDCDQCNAFEAVRKELRGE